MTAADAHETLQELLAERAAVLAGAVLAQPGELDDLDIMIRDVRDAWVGAAVTEIATLRGQISGPQRG